MARVPPGKPRPYFVVDRGLRIVDWPDAVKTSFGLAPKAALGRHCREVLAEKCGPPKTGGPCAASCGKLAMGDGRTVLWPALFAAKEDRLLFLGVLADALEGDDLHGNLTQALGILRRLVSADSAKIFLTDPETGELVLTAYDGGLNDGTRAPPPSTRSKAPGKQRPPKSDLSIPLLDRGRALGALYVQWDRANAPIDRATSLLQQAAAPLSTAIRASLASLSDALHQVRDPPIRSRAWLEHLLETTLHGASATLVLPKEVQPIVSSSEAPLLCGSKMDDCPSLLTRRPVLIAGPIAPLACLKRVGRDKWLCCTPVGTADDPRGVITIDYGKALPDPPTRDLVPLRVLAREVAERVPASTPLVVAPERMTGLVVWCFGPFEVWLDGKRIPDEAFARRGAITLLKMLVLSGGKPLSQESIASRLWGDVEPAVAANRIHGLVHALRGAIEPDNVRRRWRYALHKDDFYLFDVGAATCIDVLRFRQLLVHATGARRSDPAQAMADLEEATSLYRGDLFEDDPYAEWCEDERTALREHYIEARHALAMARAATGNRTLAVDSLRAALAIDPLREDLHRELIELLIGLHRRHDALEQYRRCVGILRQELDVEPTPEIQQLGRVLTSSSPG